MGLLPRLFLLLHYTRTSRADKLADVPKKADIGDHRHLTDRSVGEALRSDVGPAAHLASWQAKDFTKKGDNYACIVTSVVVQYTLDGAHQEKTYVAKIHMNIYVSNREDVMNRIFIQEGTSLLEILPEMNKLMRQLGLPEIGVAKAYACNYEKGKEVLLLEDLRARNFKMFDRRRDMDAAHARLVLRELGKLHAASLLLERTLPSHDITKTWDVFTSAWMTDANPERYFQNFLIGQLEGAAAIMETVPNYEHVVKWLRQNKEKAVNMFLKYPATTNQQLVLIHGECWVNNLLFRYNDVGDPVEVMLVDLQSIRKDTPAVDLNFFLFTSLNGPDRRLNLEEFLKTYYTTFSSLLEAGEAPVPFTLEELRQEFRRHMIFGCVARVVLIPYVLSEAEDVPELDGITDDNLEEVSKARMRTMVNMSQREGSLLKTRLLDVFDDMTEAGLLS